MGTIMKMSSVLAGGFLVLGIGAAEAANLEVKIPFPFVVQGKTMPAGQYLLQNDDGDPSILLIRGEKGTHAATFVVTMPAAGHDPSGDTPALMFKRHETQYRLTDIWESKSEGREVSHVPAI